MTNADVKRVFDEVADLLEIQGGDSFRVSSYRRVARTVGDLTRDLHEIAAAGDLAKLPGVGKASAQKIRQLLETGKLELREKLTAEVPAGLLELLRIPNLGPKKVALLWKEREITSLAELKTALAEDALAGLKGFGPKSISQLQEGIAFLERSEGRKRLGDVWDLAETLRREVAALDGVSRVEHAGSLRRGRETVGDLDLLCIADDGPATVRTFTELPRVTRKLVAGDTKGSVLVEYAAEREIQVDLRVVPAGSFGAAWQYFTGSKEHNVRLRERAVRRGLNLNEYALSDGDRVVAAATEQQIYAALDLPWIPPELREDRGEFEFEETPQDLLSLDDIRGDLHMHTTASDGRSTIAEMAEAARRRGYAYICITDHSRSSVIANGLDIDRLRSHIGAVREAAERLTDLSLWIGAEVDILPDGALDYPDDVLAELDWVVASVHQGMTRDVAANTRRTIAAIENPYVNVIAHPTGRLLNRRDAMPLDVTEISRAAAETGTALEINAAPQRLDLRDQHARTALEHGVTLCINCDAHFVEQFDNMRFGVFTARRAGARRGNVVNTWSADQVRSFMQTKRAKLGAR